MPKNKNSNTVVITLFGGPLSTQHLYGQKGKIRYMKSEAKKVKLAYQTMVRQQSSKKRWKCYDGVCYVSVFLYFPDNRRRDWDNYHKLSMDAMEGIIFEDDSQIEEGHVYKRIDRDNPRIEIIIERKHHDERGF